ncbi:MAG: hypothetical protein ACHRHE_17520 [Tepidisphaerales bacterium]
MESKIWLWDLYPLSHNPWKNRGLPKASVSPGGILDDGCSGGLARMCGQTDRPHRSYRPTQDDFATIRRAVPATDPENPDWLVVERALIAAGHRPPFGDVSAPGLLAMLAKPAAEMPTSDKPPEQVSAESRAIALLRDNTTMSNLAISKLVGCHRTDLSNPKRMPAFMAAAKAIRAKPDRRGGQKNQRRGGHFDAIDD